MKYKLEIIYVVVSLMAGIFLAGLMTELTFRYQARGQDRDGKVITLAIPTGTADRIKLGEASPSIPDGLVFVVGDKLRVVNEDDADHQLGPLFIPAGTSAFLSFSQPENLAYACSFTPEKYLGLEVKEPLTINTRLMGILSAGVPLGTLIALYVVFAIRPGLKKEAILRG